ncbi:hypothetical protein CDD82_6431 [Ophiocordyceps australis]|uniref:DUF6987 domain-containing protein n=1 Tax=Ophiocordyceps australis TaxID=1399860 RepID=A0A2C5YV16_9HYPO|nr:hypothetical protein CDD82_6431 [Ophiocordyceps australis]
MSVKNLLRIPGEWGRDDAGEQIISQETSDAVPRTVGGVVNKAGDIIDDQGRAVGNLVDSKDAESLAGHSVTSAGDVVSSTGEVLGKASMDSGYTTQSKTGNVPQEEDKLLEKTKQAGESLGNVGKPITNTLHFTGTLTYSDSGSNQAGQDENQSQPPEEQIKPRDASREETASERRETQAGAGEATDQPLAPINLEDNDGSVAPESSISNKSANKSSVFTQNTNANDKQSSLAHGRETYKEHRQKDQDPEATILQSPIPLDEENDQDATSQFTAQSGRQRSLGQSAKSHKDGIQESQDKKEEHGDTKSETTKGTGDDEALADDTTQQSQQDADKEDEDKEPSILKNAKVNKAGNLVDDDGDVIGHLVEGDAKQLLGKRADEDGNIRDESGKIIGRAEPVAETTEEESEQPQQQPLDFSMLKNTKVNKAGNLVNEAGDVIGRLVQGDAKQLLGKRADENGNIWNDSGKIVARAEPVPEAERLGEKAFAPFENFANATVEADGRVVSDGKQVGIVVEGDAKHLKGSRVDEDGDILDRRGNVVGRAEAWDEPEQQVAPETDRSLLAGKRVNKAGNVVDSAGVIYGRVVEGNVSSLIGRMCNKEGHVMSESGDVIGKAELVPEHEREGSKEGPFAELVGCTVTKDGKVVTASGDVVGRLTSGDGKVLFGRSVDEDGDVVDRNGNVLGKAERWEEAVVEKKKNALAGRRVNREGNVVDEDFHIIAKLTSGDVGICSGMEIDQDGDVVNSKGHTIGHVSLLQDIAEPEAEPSESPEDKEKREQAERDRKLAGQLSAAVEQSLDKIRPICKLITDKIDRAERTPKEELDEEQLVREVKPLIEEGGKILTETNGVIRGLDPDGRIQRNAKQKAGTRDASPEEYHLAEVLKELTGTVSQTIDNAKRKIEGMPHAKKELNPLWGLLSEPLFQILAAVGLLLNGVLGLVGRLLGGLGLGGLVDHLLGGLGLNKILGSLGLGSALDALTGKKNKK